MKQYKEALVSGAGFAGLTMAYRLHKMGYKVTLVEAGDTLKMGGTPVDIKDQTVEIVKQMGLFEQIKAQRIGPEKWEFKNADDVTEHTVFMDRLADDEFEIERDALLQMLFDLVKNEVQCSFGNSIVDLKEEKDYVAVTFKNGDSGRFALVFGCDGIHSNVRKCWFGPEADYVHVPGPCFALAISKKLLIEEGAYQMYAEPNKGVALYAYHQKTDIIFTFRPDKEIPYDFRDVVQQKKLITEQFKGMRWRTPELLEQLLDADSFYFDRFCQVKMPSWTKGRVALAGDAAYCASPAAGMGGSLAIIGATALADALEQHDGNYKTAFEAYDNNLRPFVETVQSDAIEMLDKLLPRTDAAIQQRYREGIS